MAENPDIQLVRMAAQLEPTQWRLAKAEADLRDCRARLAALHRRAGRVVDECGYWDGEPILHDNTPYCEVAEEDIDALRDEWALADDWLARRQEAAMAERDLPTVTELASAIPDAAPSVGQEMAALRAERDSLLRQIETWQEVHAQDVARSNRFYADLATANALVARLEARLLAQGDAIAACRARLAALERVAARARYIHPQSCTLRLPDCAICAALAALDTLEEGRDD